MRLNRYLDREAEKFAAAPEQQPANICGVLIHTRPERTPEVRAQLACVPGVEIHADSQDGRLVVTVEDTPDSWAGATIASFSDIPGVISTALVYHYCDTADLEEEMAQ